MIIKFFGRVTDEDTKGSAEDLLKDLGIEFTKVAMTSGIIERTDSSVTYGIKIDISRPIVDGTEKPLTGAELNALDCRFSNLTRESVKPVHERLAELEAKVKILEGA